jgi:hypothetical protein
VIGPACYCPTWLLIARLADALGVKDYAALPGCWVCELDHEWALVVNGHRVTEDCAGLTVPPGVCVVTRHGLAVAWIAPAGMRFKEPGGWEALYNALQRHERWFANPA